MIQRRRNQESERKKEETSLRGNLVECFLKKNLDNTSRNFNFDETMKDITLYINHRGHIKLVKKLIEENEEGQAIRAQGGCLGTKSR